MVTSRKFPNEWSSKDNFGSSRKEPRAVKPSGAPNSMAAGIIGFVLLVVVVSLLGSALARVLHTAGVVQWQLSVLEVFAISSISVTLRAIDRAVFGAIDRFGGNK
jgi:hypothetical protein